MWSKALLYRTPTLIPTNHANIEQAVGSHDADNEHIETIAGSTAFNDALMREHPTLMSPTTILLFACTLLGCLCQ